MVSQNLNISYLNFVTPLIHLKFKLIPFISILFLPVSSTLSLASHLFMNVVFIDFPIIKGIGFVDI
jgi:hypothetical protein